MTLPAVIRAQKRFKQSNEIQEKNCREHQTAIEKNGKNLAVKPMIWWGRWDLNMAYDKVAYDKEGNLRRRNLTVEKLGL